MFDTQLLVKNPNIGLTIYSTLSAALVAVILLTGWPTYHFEIRGGPIPLWYYAVPGLLILPIICAEPEYALRFLKHPLLWWFIVFTVSGLLWLLMSQDFVEAASRQWRIRVLAFFFFYTITILCIGAHRPYVALVIVGCVLLACAANWIDVLRPYRFVPMGMEKAEGRGAGFFINPNIAASFIAMATIVALPFVPMRFRSALILCAAVGIAPTFSRSGYLYAGVILIGGIALKLLNRAQTVLLLTAVPLLIISATVSYDFLLAASDDVHVQNVIKRLEWFEGAEEDAAVEGRKIGAAQAWQMFVDSPLIGRGIGATTLAELEGPHNMYLMLMGEQGFLGLLLYVSLLAILAIHGRRLARTAQDDEGRDVGRSLVLYAAFLAAYGFFSHNVLEEAQSICVMAFVVAAAAQSARAGQLSRAPSAPMRPIAGHPQRARRIGSVDWT